MPSPPRASILPCPNLARRIQNSTLEKWVNKVKLNITLDQEASFQLLFRYLFGENLFQ